MPSNPVTRPFQASSPEKKTPPESDEHEDSAGPSSSSQDSPPAKDAPPPPDADVWIQVEKRHRQPAAKVPRPSRPSSPVLPPPSSSRFMSSSLPSLVSSHSPFPPFLFFLSPFCFFLSVESSSHHEVYLHCLSRQDKHSPLSCPSNELFCMYFFGLWLPAVSLTCVPHLHRLGARRRFGERPPGASPGPPRSGGAGLPV